MRKTFTEINEAQRFYVEQHISGKDVILRTIVPGKSWEVIVFSDQVY